MFQYLLLDTKVIKALNIALSESIFNPRLFFYN